MDKSKFNLGIIESHVHTQYGDFGGYIQIDGFHASHIYQLCEDHGVDMDKYFLIGFGAGESTIDGIGQNRSLQCRAIVIDKSEYGQSYNEITTKLKSNGGKVQARQFNFSVPYVDLSKYIKRFDFMVTSELSKNISEIELPEQEY
jgi:hypothetical protein